MRAQRGQSPAVEAAVIIPGLVLLVGLLIVAAQISLVRQEVQGIVAAAARAGSLERSMQAGERVAREHVEEGLQAVACRDADVRVDASGLRAPVGVAGDVEVTVRCDVDLRAVTLSFLPGSMEIEASGDSPVDRYRGR